MFHQSHLALGIQSLKNDDLLLRNYINIYPESPLLKDAVNYLINYYYIKGMIQQELDLYNKYLDQFKNDYLFLNQYSWRMAELNKNLNDGLAKVNIALSLLDKSEQGYANIIDTKAEILWKLGNSKEAVIVINEALEIEPNNEYYQIQKEKFVDSSNY